MAVQVTVNIKLANLGEYEYRTQSGPVPDAPNGNGKHPEPGRIVPQTSSLIAPGLARRLPA